MYCNKCIHKEVCAGFEVTQADCNHFLDSTKMVELPCKPDDDLYWYCEDENEKYEFEKQLIIQQSEIDSLKKYIQENGIKTENKIQYTVEMVLFEIWGAIQTSDSTYDIQNIARAAMARVGLLEGETNDLRKN